MIQPSNITAWLDDQWIKCLKHACELDEYQDYGLEVRDLPSYTPSEGQKWGKVMIYSFIRGMLP